jgi:carboxylesterase type B
MSSSSDLLDHPTLGCRIKGQNFSSTVQYRGLKYASIPSRFADSVPISTLRANAVGTFDATKFGPSCPHKIGAQAWDLTLVGDVKLNCEAGQGDSEVMDEFECLHVNVTVPKEAKSRDGKGLPVFVWIHGGGLSMGANSWPQYDLRRFVERSIATGKPVIGVSVNYRVGVFGFLASRSIGAGGNMGFKDQVLAFQWIKCHIAGFGGDPENVTAAGESAGGISLSTLLCAETGPLFKRVVIMSGEVTLRKPRNARWHEEMFEDQFTFLGLERFQTEKKRLKLKEMPTVEIGAKLPLAQHFCGHVDGVWLKKDVTLNTLEDSMQPVHKPDWCKEAVVGDTGDDGTILKARILDNPKSLERLHELCAKYLTLSETNSLLSAYHLTNSASLTNEEKQTNIRTLASELRFHLPTLYVLKGWQASRGAKAARYNFHIPNPFPGTFKNLASHELDVAFLLQNFNDLMNEKHRKLAEGMADHFINFINGDGWGKDGYVTVIAENGIENVEEQEYDRRYRGGRGRVLKSIGTQKLWKLAEDWQGVRPEVEAERPLRAKL